MISDRFFLSFDELLGILLQRIAEPAPSRIQLVAGPRQVGKTTLLAKLAKEIGPSAIYASMDGPEAMVAGFWERLWVRAEQVAGEHGRAVLFLDEIQHLDQWSSLLKSEWDRIVRVRVPMHVVASGSSSLLIGTGAKESLAGRFERLTFPHWNAEVLAKAFSVSMAEATDYFISHGSYPGAFQFRHDHPRWLAYVRDSIIEPAIGRDILALESIRRPALLRQIFSIAATLPAQIISLQKLQGQLQDSGALATISHYLELLEHAFLIATVHKHVNRPLRLRDSPPKIVVLNNAISAALDPRGIPDQQREPERFGYWVENACMSFLWNRGVAFSYWREEPFEVDIIIDGKEKLAIEVKTGPYSSNDLNGLLQFTKQYPQFKPLVLCDEDKTAAANRIGLETKPWRQFLAGDIIPHS